MVKCCLFLALSPSSYLKNRYWRSVWEGGGAAMGKKKGKSCLYPANTVFPCAVLKLHRGTSLCLCFVSVISVPFSIITWQLVPPGGGFWLLIYLFGSGIGFFFGPRRGLAEHLNQSMPPHPEQPSPNRSSPGDCGQCLPTSIFVSALPVPSRPPPLEVGRGQTETGRG